MTNKLFKAEQITGDDLITLTDGQLKQVQGLLFEMLCEIIEVCEDNNIRYSLCGGSALGAYRHGGFIPWDDDVDLFIPRADFNRFTNIFSKELGNKYWLHTPQNRKNFKILLSRIRKKNTVYRMRDDLDNDQAGLFIDIFPLENTYDNVILRYFHGFLSMFMGFALSCRKYRADKEQLLKYLNNDRVAKSIKQKSFIGMFFSFASVNTWVEWADRVHTMCRDHHSKYVVCPSGRKYFLGEIYLRENICKTKQGLFYSKPVNLPYDTEGYLRQLFGDDYMVIPDIENRESHVLWELKIN